MNSKVFTLPTLAYLLVAMVATIYGLTIALGIIMPALKLTIAVSVAVLTARAAANRLN